MKRILCLTTGWALVLLTGCVTLSVYPYYNANDVRFDPALLGVWIEPGKSEDESWSFEKINEQIYRMTVSEKSEKTEFDARLFKLKDHMFLDCLVREHSDYSAPCHLLLRVDRLQPTLELRPLDYKWLGQLLEKRPKALRHTIVTQASPPQGNETKSFVLTADTAELQKFVLKHVHTKEAWSDAMVLKRK